MNAAELLVDLSERGVQVRPDGDLLRLRPKSRLTAGLLAEVKTHKPDLLTLLGTDWPPQCLEAAKRFRVPYACLYPLIGKTVETPGGPGKLLQVLGRAAAVRLKSQSKVKYLDWRTIRPLLG